MIHRLLSLVLIFTGICFSVRASEPPSLPRSVRLNNVHNFWLTGYSPKPGSDVFKRDLEQLSKRSAITIVEVKCFSNITPQMIKSINPSAKVYCWYNLCAKNDWDSDWSNPSDASRMQCPLAKAVIDKKDWWLRDGEGNIIKEGDRCYYLDVGKPGLKEEYLKNLLARLSSKGFDGVVFDCLFPSIINNWFPPTTESWFATHPFPQAYPTDKDWFEKAWKPFFRYVMDGLHASGYRIIGNCGGEYTTANAEKRWQRSLLDGVIYEQGAVGWRQDGSGWLEGSVIEQRINSLSQDPLEVWQADNGLISEAPDYEARHLVSLAMYYVGIPVSQAQRSYGNPFDRTPHWQSIWDFSIGTPAEAVATKKPGRYFWSRRYTNGLVLLNYEGSSTSYSLDRTYKDHEGKSYSGTVTLPPHTALMLAAVGK